MVGPFVVGEDDEDATSDGDHAGLGVAGAGTVGFARFDAQHPLTAVVAAVPGDAAAAGGAAYVVEGSVGDLHRA
jgi:hypothetical protein